MSKQAILTCLDALLAYPQYAPTQTILLYRTMELVSQLPNQLVVYNVFFKDKTNLVVFTLDELREHIGSPQFFYAVKYWQTPSGTKREGLSPVDLQQIKSA